MNCYSRHRKLIQGITEGVGVREGLVLHSSKIVPGGIMEKLEQETLWISGWKEKEAPKDDGRWIEA